MDFDDVPHVGDWGCAHIAGGGAMSMPTSVRGTNFFIAPEFRITKMMRTACDVFSFGIMMWLIMHPTQAHDPLPGVADHMVPVAMEEGRRPEVDTTLPQGVQRLITDCWKTEAEQRPTMLAIHKRLQASLADL